MTPFRIAGFAILIAGSCHLGWTIRSDIESGTIVATTSLATVSVNSVTDYLKLRQRASGSLWGDDVRPLALKSEPFQLSAGALPLTFVVKIDEKNSLGKDPRAAVSKSTFSLIDHTGTTLENVTVGQLTGFGLLRGMSRSSSYRVATWIVLKSGLYTFIGALDRRYI